MTKLERQFKEIKKRYIEQINDVQDGVYDNLIQLVKDCNDDPDLQYKVLKMRNKILRENKKNCEKLWGLNYSLSFDENEG